MFLTDMLTKMPATAFALANSKNSGSVTNLPLFFSAGFLGSYSNSKVGLEIIPFWGKVLLCAKQAVKQQNCEKRLKSRFVISPMAFDAVTGKSVTTPSTETSLSINCRLHKKVLMSFDNPIASGLPSGKRPVNPPRAITRGSLPASKVRE
ncbi:hypothetical protein Lal_00006768 [Lupinus albus]|nr:hypothetical protein Lal_00006768 [Lupinus albus]